MRKLILPVVIVLASLVSPCRAALELTGGPPRSFGGRTITRTFKVDVAGAATLEWRTRVMRGIIERGNMPVDGPGEVTLELKLPAVRARVELVQEVQVKRGDAVVESGEFPMELFPEGLLAPTDVRNPLLGVIDREGRVAGFLKKAGWQVLPITAGLQFTEIAGGVVVVAHHQEDSLGEPMNGLRQFVQEGGTAIFLEQGDDPFRNAYDDEKPWKFAGESAAGAVPLLAKRHVALLDLQPGDLSNWAGSGFVCNHILAWPEWRQRRIWMVSADKRELPLVMECWGDKGRIIFCQLDVGQSIEREPAAQLLLRNMIAYARTTPLPAPVRITSLAVPKEAVVKGRFDTARFVPAPTPEALKEALAQLFFLTAPDGEAPKPGMDLVEYLREGSPIVVQSAFGEEITEALSDLLKTLNERLTGAGEVPRATMPRLVPHNLAGDESFKCDYESAITWGVPMEMLSRAAAADDARFLAPDNAASPFFKPLTQPAALAKFERGKARIIFCALPLDDPENKDLQKVMEQVLANLAVEAGKEGTYSVNQTGVSDSLGR